MLVVTDSCDTLGTRLGMSFSISLFFFILLVFEVRFFRALGSWEICWSLPWRWGKGIHVIARLRPVNLVVT